MIIMAETKVAKISRLLKVRKVLKSKKPTFIRQDAHKLKKLEQKWVKPKGIDSKMRLRLKGYRRSVTKGWKSPAAVKGLSREGLQVVTVVSESQLSKIDKSMQIALIPSTMGNRKKLMLVKKAQELGIKLLNFSQPEKYVSRVENGMKERKAVQEKKEAKKEERAKSDKAKEEKAAKKDEKKESKTDGKKDDSSVSSASETVVDEEKEKKKEMDKVLTQTQ